MFRNKNPLLTKGLFAIFIAAIAGVVGTVNYASADIGQSATRPNKAVCMAAGFTNYGKCIKVWAQDKSGYGHGTETALAASDDFQLAVTSDTTSFKTKVNALTAALKLQLTPSAAPAAQSFGVSFNNATTVYNQQVNGAFVAFNKAVSAAADTATSKDQFIDRFNHAKADYLNAIDASKNQLADKINNAGGNSNAVAKDTFMNGFNTSRDAYSNQLEAAKNDFADSVSGL